MGPWGMQNIKESSYLAQIEMQIPKIFNIVMSWIFSKSFTFRWSWFYSDPCKDIVDKIV